MSSNNDTRKVADEIGRQVFECMHAEEPPEKPYWDFLEYRDYLKTSRNSSPNVDEIVGRCTIDFGPAAPNIVLT